MTLNGTLTLRIDVLRVEHRQEPILSTIAEIAANLMQLQLRAKTVLSNSAVHQANAGDELIAVLEVADFKGQPFEGRDFEEHRLERHGSQTLQLETITLAIPPDQSASWQVCA